MSIIGEGAKVKERPSREKAAINYKYLSEGLPQPDLSKCGSDLNRNASVQSGLSVVSGGLAENTDSATGGEAESSSVTQTELSNLDLEFKEWCLLFNR